MNLHVKASFVAVEGRPGILPSWDLVNHNMDCLAELEMESPCILHVTKYKNRYGTAEDLKNVESVPVPMHTVWYVLIETSRSATPIAVCLKENFSSRRLMNKTQCPDF
jgi:hypothetical protein